MEEKDKRVLENILNDYQKTHQDLECWLDEDGYIGFKKRKKNG